MGVCSVSLESIESHQVLGDDKQSGFCLSTFGAAAVEAFQAAMFLCVGKAELHRLPSQRISCPDVWAVHLFSLSIQ